MTTTAFEQHYSISQIANVWGQPRSTVYRAFRDEPGVLRIRIGAKKVRALLRVPASLVNAKAPTGVVEVGK
jgi:hypothetical protein